MKPGHAGPPEEMEVSQPSLAFLDVRLEEIDRLSELFTFTTARLHMPLDKTPRPPVDHLPEIPAMELLE